MWHVVLAVKDEREGALAAAEAAVVPILDRCAAPCRARLGQSRPSKQVVNIMKGTRGRRRLLTDAQVEKIMAWHRTRKSLKAFAQEMGLKASFVTYVIGRKGQYKQPSPELRQAALDERHAKMQALREGGWR